MFGLSIVFLVSQAILVVTWFDVPNFSENARLAIRPDASEAEQIRLAIAANDISGGWFQNIAITLIFIVWPIMIAESVFHWMTRPWNTDTKKYHFFSFLFCGMPSLRLCARSYEMHDRLWLPGLGWRTPNKRLRRRLAKKLSIPMIMIALLILPVFVIEFFMKVQVAEYSWLRVLLHISTGVIWFAFAAEFILMVAVAKKKIDYCRTHWVDLVIILLPLVSFLRFLRVMRVQQVIKFARVYRLRGTSIKALRALIVLDSVERLLTNNTERAIDRLQAKLDDVETQAKQLRRRMYKLRKKLAQEEQAKAEAESKVKTKAQPDGSTNDDTPAVPELSGSRSECPTD
ncbi:MAG: potassium channel protein [Rubripirellula sp.]|nr:potassium channel protein [Rubripirellula sp.]